MSDFPRGGDVEATRKWLDDEGFSGVFVGWEANAILGKSDDFIKSQFGESPEEQEKAEMLCGFLQTAREISHYDCFDTDIHSISARSSQSLLGKRDIEALKESIAKVVKEGIAKKVKEVKGVMESIAKEVKEVKGVMEGIAKEVKEVKEIIAAAMNPEHCGQSKSQATFFLAEVNRIKHDTVNYNWSFPREGPSFLLQSEIDDYDEKICNVPREKERILVQEIFPSLSERLRLPNGYVLVNSEVDAWLPPSLINLSTGALVRPNLFAAPAWSIDFLPPYQNASADVRGVPIQHGKVVDRKNFRDILILDAKAGNTLMDNEIGDFFAYLSNPTAYFKCSCRGMLFNQQEFILVDFLCGHLKRFLREKWTTAGTLRLIKNS